MSKLNEVNRMIEVIENEKLVTIEKDGTASFAKDGFQKLLPEGLTEDTVNKSVRASTDAAAAIAVVVGSNSKKVFDENKDLQVVSLKTKLGKYGSVDVVQKREVEFTDMKAERKEGEPAPKMKKHGHISARFDISDTMSSGEINKHERVTKQWSGLSS